MTAQKIDVLHGITPPSPIETVVEAIPNYVVLRTTVPVTRMNPDHARHVAAALLRAADESELQLTDSTANEANHEH